MNEKYKIEYAFQAYNSIRMCYQKLIDFSNPAVIRVDVKQQVVM